MQNQIIDEKPTLSVTSRAEWRDWLSQNHNSCHEMWLIIYKKLTGKQSFTKSEALDDAICYGWIDSLVKSIDEEKYMQKFTPRKPDSQWSEINKKRVAELETSGLIKAPGQALIDHARATGEWYVHRAVSRNVEMPQELTKALSSSAVAQKKWDKLPASHRRQYLQWISQAKREETKQRRIKNCINILASGQSPNTL